MKKQNPYLSVIIPVFNEQKRLGNINSIIDFFKKQKFSWEVIIINDGSTDKTLKLLNSLQKKLKFKLVSYAPNRGKGAAIKQGMLSAKGKYRFFLDVDLSTPITEFNKLLPHFKKYPIIIGSRKMKNSKIIIRQPIVREALGKMFTKMSQTILQMDISDFTCGFKCFSDKAAEEIFSRQQIGRWGFDSEILYIGKIKKHSIKEIPVEWRNDLGTKVKFPDAIIYSLTELVKIKLNEIKGLYK